MCIVSHNLQGVRRQQGSHVSVYTLTLDAVPSRHDIIGARPSSLEMWTLVLEPNLSLTLL